MNLFSFVKNMCFDHVEACKVVEGNNDRIVIAVEAPVTMRRTARLLVVNRVEDDGAVRAKEQLFIMLSANPRVKLM